MKKVNVILTLLFLAITFLWISNAFADVHTATSCSQSAVQSAINSSSSGDLVVVPSGTCPWTSGVTINGKSIVVQGAGIDQTIITLTSGSAFTLRGNQSSRVTGFTVNCGAGGVTPVSIFGGTNWRIDHNKFTSTNFNYMWVDAISGAGINYIPCGVWDHNIINGLNIVTFGRGHQEWYEPTNLGSVEATYIEDNTFIGNINSIDVADANYGGRVVFRYNTITVHASVADSYFGNFQWHSLQGDGNVRGARKFEVYGNVWESYRSSPSAVAIWPRAGTGVVFSNSFINYGSTALLLDNVRSYEPRGSYGQCNGSATGNIDGNEAGQYGYPCRDQPGRGKDATLFVFGSKPYPSQASEPIYQWGNYRYTTRASYEKGSAYGTVVDFYVDGAGYSKTHIVENRDFYNGTQKLGYTPYTYPHPVTTGGNPAPGPPQNVHIIQ